ncbi:hypothetical protein A2960_02940 [Candidatus Gottesmanbacteria bacterium RIFCSPLOWO2_01_FULL_39_12b]|uniref:3-phosphoglycerate dehydrogenase n=1 Tax=Candidatus Gottesmanbacteria bacterium RIFCSPLOWO2_01_FULL_39_12b TaxID=1798388 RepID=A0A1F6ARF5_9BACT|nr:MAG: hypothetical protein A2960_02940 [Candidatus Gottesmanbacteria bacterium RIFCSPLOWO2_01_FULL_39_12b]
MKILISDKIDENALSYLKEQKIDVDYLPEITPEELLKSISTYDALILRSRTRVTKEVIESGINLKVIARAGTGLDNIDIKAAEQKNIKVINTPSANVTAVAELTLGLMISLFRKLGLAYTSMKEGLWLKKDLKGSELNGKTIGIIGFGRIGKKVSELLSVFGVEILIYDLQNSTCSLEELFTRSDLITIHVALTPVTRGFINKKLLSLMKPSAFLINISRGEVVDEENLYEALVNKRIAGCALDVFWQEPLSADSRFRKLDNVILTPHIGAATHEALKKASQSVAEDVVRALKGE